MFGILKMVGHIPDCTAMHILMLLNDQELPGSSLGPLYFQPQQRHMYTLKLGHIANFIEISDNFT